MNRQKNVYRPFILSQISYTKAMNASPYPIRINRYLAEKGYATRREADNIILSRRVFINGRLAVLGDKVGEKDAVEVRQESAGQKKEYSYFAFYKPAGIVTHSPLPGQKSIKNILDTKPAVFPVGRLDRASEGLIILTNDGRITDRLLNPRYEHEKEYIVKTIMPFKDGFLKRMARGVRIEGYLTKPAQTYRLGEQAFRIILTEGKKHQIRRMCAALGNDVRSLKRMRIMNIELRSLRPGEQRMLEGKELTIFLQSLGLA